MHAAVAACMPGVGRLRQLIWPLLTILPFSTR
ncbi:hypothetical protein FHX82_003938 [Amycolatopsis bartoniae]|nr:hypothetical protein [Amycolatopsis bartoniae]